MGKDLRGCLTVISRNNSDKWNVWRHLVEGQGAFFVGDDCVWVGYG